MSWATVKRSRNDCLLDCLQEVRLDQFAGNFATRGITDCAKLAALERQQFATYGITSPTDITRLTKLISIIRDLRADGLICRHGAESKPVGENSDFSRKTSSVPGELWKRSTTVHRCQKKQFTDRRAVNDTENISTLHDITDTQPKTTTPHRRPTRDAQRPRRGVKHAATTAGGQLSRHSVSAETQCDGPTSFTPLCQRTVSHLPTHVEEKVS